MDCTRLDHVRVVLVGTTHPGNIGAAARAMKNMGLRHLHLVAPARFPSAEASARASGADDVLAEARVWSGLDEALQGCTLVLGATARLRHIAVPLLDSRAAGARLAAAAGAAAVVFGREHSGLTNEEMDRCNCLLHIPANPVYPSLNLGAAVQVVTYETMMAARGGAAAPAAARGLATAEQVEGFYRHLEQALMDVEFLDPAQPRLLMRRLRRLFSRAQLEEREVNILRGILTAAQRAAGR